MKLLLPLVCALPLFIASCASSPLASDKSAEPWFAHDVYFDLNDDSPEARKALVKSCWDQLSKLDGVRFFACGQRDESLTSPVNDQDYDVSLHVIFESRSAQDAYQVHPKHLAFVTLHLDSWKGVRVFDSFVHGAFTK